MSSERVVASIIIANRNGERVLADCLRAVARYTRVGHEVWVVDNASEDEEFVRAREKWSRKLDWHFLALKQDEGPVVARVSAVGKAKGEYLVFLDSDTEVTTGWLAGVVKYLDENPEVGGGQLKLMRWNRQQVFDSAGDKLTKWGFLAERAREAEDKGQFDSPEAIISGKMAAMVVRRSVYEEIGGLDESLWMYWEEPDLGWRVWKAGYRFEYLPQGLVYHKYGSGLKPVSEEWTRRITYLGCRNQLAVIAKNGVGLARWRMLAGVGLGWLGLAGLMLVRRQFGRVAEVGRAFAWLGLNWRQVGQRRRELRKRLGRRFFADGEWMSEVSVVRGWRWYWGKGINYVLGRPF